MNKQCTYDEESRYKDLFQRVRVGGSLAQSYVEAHLGGPVRNL